MNKKGQKKDLSLFSKSSIKWVTSKKNLSLFLNSILNPKYTDIKEKKSQEKKEI